MSFNGIGMITEDLALKNIIMEHDFSYFVTVQPKRVIGLNLAKMLESNFEDVRVKIIEKDNRKKILITHYQFISTVLDTDLNILNRWYLWDNNTHPTEGHKYFQIYKDMVNRNVKKNNYNY